MSAGLEHGLWLVVLYTAPSGSALECASFLGTDTWLLNWERWS